MSRTLIAFAFVIAAAASVSASTCEVTPQSYNAGDGTVLTDVAHILTLTANCPPNVAPVYANLNGRTLAVVRGESGGYQVSWTQNIDKASSGSYDIQFFDDEGYQQLKKAQRSGSSGPAPLFSVPFSHSSPYRGPLFQAEFVVLVGGLILTYYAIALRLKIVAKKI